MMNDGGKKMTKKRVKYMVQSIAIMAVATFLSFFLQSYGIRKENILMNIQKSLIQFYKKELPMPKK